MMNFKMKARILASAAVLFCCLSCIENNTQLGGSLIPVGQTYTFYTAECPIENISMKMADSLSGYSSSRITVGAVRDEDYGLSTRSAVVTLVPLFVDSFDFGENPVFKNFHFSAARDTTSQAGDDQECILQTLKIYELEKPIDGEADFDCNKPLSHLNTKINKGTILYNGADSLSFDFTEEFGKRFLTITEDELSDIDKYFERFPGIYIESDNPVGNGGRINIFDLQLDYNSDYLYVQGNYAKLSFSAEYDGTRKDTSLLFYYGAYGFHDIDSLLTNSSTGSFPQYSLNLTSHETRSLSGNATDKIYIEGGGGLKPVISGKEIKRLAEKAISECGVDPSMAIINKATIVMPFEFPDDYTTMTRWPQILSPTCRIIDDDSVSFMGLTDSSSSDEDQGDINRSLLQYSPDITFHLQEMMKIDENDTESAKTQMLENGEYDIWFLIMANEVITTTTSGSSDLSELYNYLAYQSYYNDIYGGYGYGSGYNSYYSNYYSYAMMASYAASSTTSQSVSVLLDKDRYYKATLNGPESDRHPVLKIVFAIPNE